MFNKICSKFAFLLLIFLTHKQNLKAFTVKYTGKITQLKMFD